MVGRIWWFAGIVGAWALTSAAQAGVIVVERYDGPVYGRPVYVRRVYPRTVVHEVPVYVERPVIVERQVIVEKKVPAPAAPPPRTTAPTLTRSPKLDPKLRPVGSGQATNKPVSETVELKPIETQLVPVPPVPSEPAPQAAAPVSAPGQELIEWKGAIPAGETMEYTFTHPITRMQFTIPIPAHGLKKEDPGKWEIELEYQRGEIEIEFKRNGRVKVKYEFDD